MKSQLKEPKQLQLYLVTDEAMYAEKGLIETVLDAIDGGVSMVQLRDKNASDRQLYHKACALHEAINGRVPLLLNDRVKIAKKANLEGAHIGQSDGTIEQARAILGADAWLGLSVTNIQQLQAVNPNKLDYIGLGPVFATNTKKNHATPIGIEGVKALSEQSPVPNVAIGGVKSEHAGALAQTGVNGICVVSAICAADDPKYAAQALLKNFKEVR